MIVNSWKIDGAMKKEEVTFKVTSCYKDWVFLRSEVCWTSGELCTKWRECYKCQIDLALSVVNTVVSVVFYLASPINVRSRSLSLSGILFIKSFAHSKKDTLCGKLTVNYVEEIKIWRNLTSSLVKKILSLVFGAAANALLGAITYKENHFCFKMIITGRVIDLSAA